MEPATHRGNDSVRPTEERPGRSQGHRQSRYGNDAGDRDEGTRKIIISGARTPRTGTWRKPPGTKRGDDGHPIRLPEARAKCREALERHRRSQPMQLWNDAVIKKSPEEDNRPRERESSRKHLNNLNAKEWIKFTKSWFILSGKADREKTAAHPATFPLELPTAIHRVLHKQERICPGSLRRHRDDSGRRGLLGTKLHRDRTSTGVHRVRPSEDAGHNPRRRRTGLAQQP